MLSLKLKKLNPSGFTMIELLIYISLTVMIFLAVASFSKIILENRMRSQVISDVEYHGYRIMDTIGFAVRNAQNITIPAAGNISPGITLNMADTLKDPTVFFLDNGVLKVQEAGSQFVDMSNEHIIVSDISFENLSRPDTPGTIKYSFTLKYNNPANRGEYSYSKTFYSSASLR